MESFNWMSPPADRQAECPLDVQSRGRPLTEVEQEFATALETIFSEGCHDMALVAAKLGEKQVVAPVSQSTSWSIDTLHVELAAINAQLDAAFEEHGYGA